jgi:hypothetical protein
MAQAVAALANVLERERQAAIAADVDALTELQDEKRACVAQLRSTEPDPTTMGPLVDRAQANIRLIRLLVQCLRGTVEPEGTPVYSATGERQPLAERSRRGVL